MVITFKKRTTNEIKNLLATGINFQDVQPNTLNLQNRGAMIKYQWTRKKCVLFSEIHEQLNGNIKR